MDCPENIDEFLKSLLQPDVDDDAPIVALCDEQRAFIERILAAVTTGSKAVFVVLHPTDRMQYMLLNTNRTAAIALLATVMERTAEALEADVE